jgi:PEP-CTERM motif
MLAAGIPLSLGVVMTRIRLCALTAVLAVLTQAAITPAQSGTLTTTTANNGSGGVFLALTPLNPTGSALNSFSTYYGSAAGTAVSVEVWTRPGTYTGFTASNDGWTLTQTLAGTSQGTTTLALLNLTTPIDLPAGTTTSVYLHSVTAGGGIRYNGTNAAPPTTTWSNTDLQLFSDVSRTGAASFGGTQFSPRTFAGELNYTLTPIPEPTTVGAIGAGVLGLRAVLLRRTRYVRKVEQGAR